MKRQFLHIAFFLLYSLVLLPLPSYAHYCGNVRVEKNCCAEENEEQHNNGPSIEASCCTDVLLPGIADDEHQSLQELNWVSTENHAQSSISTNFLQSFVALGKTKRLLEYYHHFSPPTRVLHKLYQQFVVYH